jgi:hypothetical protein
MNRVTVCTYAANPTPEGSVTRAADRPAAAADPQEVTSRRQQMEQREHRQSEQALSSALVPPRITRKVFRED